jgi:cell wall-associated NlpC family hydrolase
MKNPSRSSAIVRLLLLFLAFSMTAMLYGCGKSSASVPVFSGPSRGAAIARSAGSQVGKPYRYGASSPERGFDCSGLVQWACRQNGVTVPRESKAQARTGHAVDRADLLPGDIVVFRIPWSGFHTGVYLGQGRFVHSPRPRTRVRVESLDSRYWRKNFAGGRRVARP